MSTPGNCFLCLSGFLSLGCNTAIPETTRSFAKGLRGTKTRSQGSLLLAGENYTGNKQSLLSDTSVCKKHCLYPTMGWLSTGDICGVGECRASSAGVAKMLCALASVGSRDWPPALGCCFLLGLLWPADWTWRPTLALSYGVISWTLTACWTWGTKSSAWPCILGGQAWALMHIKHSLLLHCHPSLLWLQWEKKRNVSK